MLIVLRMIILSNYQALPIGWKIMSKLKISVLFAHCIIVILSTMCFSLASAKEQPRFFDDRDTSTETSRDLTSFATGITLNTLKSSFDSFGTLEAALDIDSAQAVKTYSLDALIPFYNDSSSLFFTQAGIRNNDSRKISNFGLGYRHLYDEWLVGYNIFYDFLWESHSTRYGAGVELLTHSHRLSLNSYRRISDWKQSHQHSSYQERPANGWDINLESWLDNLPQLSSRLMFEKYYGNEVALTHFNSRTRDPYSLSVGASYTPVPAITATLDLANSRSSSSTVQAGLQFTFRMGVELSDQFSGAQVANLRTLPVMSKDIVKRNNNIVMNYRKNLSLDLAFPSEIRGVAGADYTFYPVVQSSNGLERIELNDAELIAAGGRVLLNTGKMITLRLPSIHQPDPVKLSGIAIDKLGHRSRLAETKIYTTVVHHVLSINTNKSIAYADGSDEIEFTMHVSDAKGNAVPDEYVSLVTDGGRLSVTSGKTDSSGDLVTSLSSTESGEFHVKLVDGVDELTHAGVTFLTSVKGTLNASKNEIWADGKDSAFILLKLEDGNGKPLSGRVVNWDSSAGTLSAASSVTDDKGETTVIMTSKLHGEAVITASSGESRWNSETIFMRDSTSVLSITTDQSSAVANGRDAIQLTAVVKRADDKPIEGKTVIWDSSIGVLSDTSSVTDSKGIAHTSITSEKEGNGLVHARLPDEDVSSNSHHVKFNEELVMFLVHSTPVPVGGESSLMLILEDQNRDPRGGETVVWSTNGGILSDSTTLTDKNGISTITLKSDNKGVFKVTANVKENKISANITFN